MAKTEHGVDVEKVPVWYLEKAINGMMPGLQMFVRDVDMGSVLAGRYMPGMIICEQAFTDATCRVGGLAKAHRISILSDHMVNFSDVVQDTEEASRRGYASRSRTHISRYWIASKLMEKSRYCFCIYPTTRTGTCSRVLR